MTCVSAQGSKCQTREESVEIEIFGMEGIPPEAIAAHNAEQGTPRNPAECQGAAECSLRASPRP